MKIPFYFLLVTLLTWAPAVMAAEDRANQPLEIGYYVYGTVGVSVAAPWGARSNGYIANNFPAVDIEPEPFVFPEYSLGFIAKRKINLGWRSMLQIAYRSMEQEVQSQDIKHTYTRTAYSLDLLESYGNWRGFVPYVGLSWNFEELAFQPTMGAKEDKRYHHLGLAGGWDLLSHPNSRWFLRTHFRWYPDTSLFYQGDRVVFPNFELSIIQFGVRFN